MLKYAKAFNLKKRRLKYALEKNAYELKSLKDKEICSYCKNIYRRCVGSTSWLCCWALRTNRLLEVEVKENGSCRNFQKRINSIDDIYFYF